MWTGPPQTAAAAAPAPEQPDALVSTVKDMQRTDPVAKEQWGAYCDTQGGGLRDPAKHNAAFIQTFISQYSSGVRIEQPAGPNLADLFKEGQRKSANWKMAWAQYCQHYGGGFADPAKHEVSFLVGFLDFLGQRGNMALTMLGGGMPGTVGAPGGKGGRRGGGGPGFHRNAASSGGGAPKSSAPAIGAAVDDPVKEQLVSRIKSYQRSGPEAKQLWWSFCDGQLGGIRDPARHDSNTLGQFVSTHGVP